MGLTDNTLFTEIVSSTSRGMLVLDAASPGLEILYVNSSFASLFGYTTDQLSRSSWLDHAVADSAEILRLKQSLACGDSLTLTLPLLLQDGDVWIGRFRLHPLRHSSDGKRPVLVEYLDDGASEADKAELLKRALGNARRRIAGSDRTDALTGLLSGSEFRSLLTRDMAIARRNRQSLCLLLFAVPEIEIYRETFGNNAADSCLRMIAAQIAGSFRRASDLCGRIGESTIAVSVHDQDSDQADRLVALVEQKARSLGLHNPRGRIDRTVVAKGVFIEAEYGADDADSLISRALAELQNRTETPKLSVVGSG